MRTTIDLPEELYRRAKVEAATQGTTLRDLIAGALKEALDRKPPEEEFEVELPLIKTGKPGTLRLTNAEIEELLT